MTFYEKSAFIDAFAICGNLVVGYSSDPKIDAAFMETEAQKILKGNGYRANVKIFKDLKPFLDRLDSMNEHKESLEEGIKFRPDERYPELSRNEPVSYTHLAENGKLLAMDALQALRSLEMCIRDRVQILPVNLTV